MLGVSRNPEHDGATSREVDWRPVWPFRSEGDSFGEIKAKAGLTCARLGSEQSQDAEWHPLRPEPFGPCIGCDEISRRGVSVLILLDRFCDRRIKRHGID